MLKDVYDQLDSKDMPPPEDSSMTEAERKSMTDYLAALFNKLETTSSKQTGPSRIRRLTSYEYDNTVKHVTGLNLKLADNFPVDGSAGEGFSNDSSILGVSPLQFEKYLEAAETIASHSQFDLKEGFSFSQSQHIPSTKKQSIEKLEKQIAKLLKEQYPKNFSIEKFIPKMMKAVNKFNKEGKKTASISSLANEFKINKFIIQRGITYFSSTYGKSIVERDALKKWFLLRNNKYSDEEAAKCIKTFVAAYKEAKTKATNIKNRKLKPYFDFKHNIRTLFSFTDKELSQNLSKQQFENYQNLKASLDFFETGMRSKYRSQFAKQIIPHIRQLMFKAHRKPTSEKEILDITKDFITATTEFGMPVAARLCVIRTFASIKFIFRHEQKTGKPTKVTDYELASRLSYFLWGAPPDQELLDLAKAKKLANPEILEKQVKRMIVNKKSSGLAKYFAAEWLTYGEILDNENPSEEKFPSYNKQLAKDMFLESAICFEYIVKNDRSVLELIDADYSFMNGRLKQHYGIKGGPTSFSKVQLKDKRRGGITTQASILTLTSYPQRSSPVLRGNWIISSLLGTPTPPPPPDAGTLPDEEIVTEELPLKKQLAKHRDTAQCRGCHQRIDPLGFPLENYDPIGRWRQKYENASIDSLGTLKDGKEINGPIELKKYLLRNKELFLKNMSRKLMGYALGRKIYYYDYYIINKMVASLKENNYRFSAMVREIVTSYQFQHKN